MRPVLVRILVAMLLLAAWFEVQHVYESESNAQKLHFSLDGAKVRSHVEVDVALVGFDPLRGDLLLRLECRPVGDLQQYDLLTEPLVVYVNASTGRSETTFRKGETTSPIEATIGMRDGEAGDYPFDRHRGTLQIVVGHPQPDGGLQGVPMSVHCETNVPGFRVEAEEVLNTPSEHAQTFVNVTLTRSLSVRLFATFVMVLMGLVAFAAGGVVRAYWVDGKAPDLPLFQWLATLLFAMVPLRNAMPGAPPIGARCDYQSFFWVEAAIALEMLVLVALWMIRRPRPTPPADTVAAGVDAPR